MPCNMSMMDTASTNYGPAVRMGNWVEDRFLEEDNMRRFKKQRDRGELAVVKARSLYDYFHKEIVLEAPKQYVRFGAVVQLMPLHLNISDRDTSEINAALSVVINERMVMRSQTINEQCELSAAPSERPCMRNSFRIIRGSEQSNHGNANVVYGQQFRLECVEPTDDPIWLYSAPIRCNLELPIATSSSSSKNGETNLSLGLVRRSKCGPSCDVPSAYTKWMCKHVDPLKRFESQGQELPSNEPLIITHAVTNRNLAVENIIMNTMFGPEFVVSVQNYCNIYKRETWKNLWVISNGQRTSAQAKSAVKH